MKNTLLLFIFFLLVSIIMTYETLAYETGDVILTGGLPYTSTELAYDDSNTTYSQFDIWGTYQNAVAEAFIFNGYGYNFSSPRYVTNVTHLSYLLGGVSTITMQLQKNINGTWSNISSVSNNAFQRFEVNRTINGIRIRMTGVNTIGKASVYHRVYELDYVFTASNSVPTIVSKTGTSITLNSNATLNYNAWFIANDHDGVSSLLDSSAKAYAVKNAVNISSSSCTPSDINTTATNYSCTLTFPFYSEHGSWNFTVKVNDTETQAKSNGTLTVNNLDSISYNRGASWLSLFSNSINNEASPITFSNLGNVAYTTLTWKGYETQYLAYKIGAGNYSMELATSSCPGFQGINDTAVTLTGASLNIGETETEMLYSCVNVPNGIGLGTYISTNDWVFEFS
jgi:hypothetical protein